MQNQKAEEQASKNEEMTKIMNALQNMDLDNEDFIDIKSFDQSKAILENAIEDLQHYLKLFEKGEYEKFPRVKTEWMKTHSLHKSSHYLNRSHDCFVFMFWKSDFSKSNQCINH